MSKRGNNEGSIYQRQSDGKWVGAVTLDNGKRKVIYGSTRKDVAARLVALQRDRQQGMPVLSERKSIAAYLGEWLTTVKPSLKARTYERYEEYVRIHISPGL